MEKVGDRVVCNVYEVVGELNSLVSDLEGFISKVDKEGHQIDSSDLAHIKAERRKIWNKIQYLNQVAEDLQEC